MLGRWSKNYGRGIWNPYLGYYEIVDYFLSLSGDFDRACRQASCFRRCITGDYR
jgi:hypothetical protein